MFSEAVKNKLSCAAFFFLPGLSYSLVTSRMPAIKESAQIDDLQLGIALPEFYRRITDNFKRAFESQGFSSFLIFSLLW